MVKEDLYAKIFHSSGLVADGGFMASFFENWDKVKGSFDVVKYRLTEIANAYIYRQNEIHARIEFKRPWANAAHEVLKFDNLGPKIRIHLMDNREVITGEHNPAKVLDIDRNLIIECNVEDWNKFFAEYETNLANSVALQKKHAEENAKIIRRCDFERAKEVYLALKDEFENEESVGVEPLPYDKWLKTQNFREASRDDLKYFEGLLNLDLKVETVKYLRQEYDLYVERCKLGIQ